MPVLMVVLLRVPLEGGLDMVFNPVGTTITGRPTRFPRQTFSQSVAFPMKASTVKLSFTSLINFPRALCACGQSSKRDTKYICEEMSINMILPRSHTNVTTNRIEHQTCT